MRRLAFVLAALACGPPPDVEPPPCRNATPGMAELGVGNLDTGFSPLADGSELKVVLGPQGQHMVTLSVRVTELEMPSSSARRVRTAIAIRKDEVVVAGTVSEIAPILRGQTADFLGLRAIVIVDDVAPLTRGMSVVETTVVDGCGREISTSKTAQLIQ